MTMQRKFVRAQLNVLGDDEVEVIMSTAALARDGHVLVPEGCEIENYRANPIFLWQHDPEHPIGTAENIEVSAQDIRAKVRFAPPGTTQKSDEVRRLVKAGVIRTVSIGFDPIDGEPLDPRKPRAGQRITRWELLEGSFVSIPSDTKAVVTARSKGNEMADRSGDQESGAASAESGIRAEIKRALARAPSVPKFRGLYEVASLAYLMEQLGYAKMCADWEKAFEEDDSQVPEMLGEVLLAAGEALVAMTKEEVGELLAGVDVNVGELDEDSEILTVEERAHIKAAPNARAKAWRRGIAAAKVRAGKTLSADTVRCLRSALDDHEEAADHIRAAQRLHKRAASTVGDLMDRAGVPADDADAGETDGDGKKVQKSDGTQEDTGARSADFKKRQADAAELAVR